MQLGPNEFVGPGFTESLIGQESPVNVLGVQYPGRIIDAIEIKTTDGRIGFEVTVEFEGPDGLFDISMIGLSHA